MLFDAVPQGNRADDDRNTNEGDIHPKISEESKPKRTEKPERYTGKNAMNRTDRTRTGSNSIKPWFSIHQQYYT